MDSWRTRLQVMYGDTGDRGQDERDAILDDSLDPLGPSTLFELAGELGARPGGLVVDIGARDGRQMRELVERFGCSTLGVEPMPANLARRVDPALDMVQAFGEQLPLRDGIADLVWVRDVLVHVPDLDAAMAEIGRIAKPGAAVLVFAVFATELLEPREAAELFEPLAIVPTSADRSNFERAVAGAGLSIERHVRLDGQWREYGEEHDNGRTSRQLLRIARLRRDPQRYAELLGADDAAIELADALYGVYQLLGKLSASIDVLRRPSQIERPASFQYSSLSRRL